MTENKIVGHTEAAPLRDYNLSAPKILEASNG